MLHSPDSLDRLRGLHVSVHVTLRFGNAMDPPMPAAVKTQRRQLGWSTNEQEWVSFEKT